MGDPHKYNKSPDNYKSIRTPGKITEQMVWGTFSKERECWKKETWIHYDQSMPKSNQLFLAMITKLVAEETCKRENAS